MSRKVIVRDFLCLRRISFCELGFVVEDVPPIAPGVVDKLAREAF